MVVFQRDICDEVFLGGPLAFLGRSLSWAARFPGPLAMHVRYPNTTVLAHIRTARKRFC